MPTIIQSSARLLIAPAVPGRAVISSPYAALEVALHTDDAELRPGRAVVPVPLATASLVQAAAAELGHRSTGRSVSDAIAGGIWPAVDTSGGLGAAGFRPAVAAITDALWDLRATLAGVPLWRLVAGLSSAELARGANLNQLDDLLSPAQATELLDRRVPGRQGRERQAERTGYPAANLGVSASPTEQGLHAARAHKDGFNHFVVTCDRPDTAVAHCQVVRRVIGPDAVIIVHAGFVPELNEAKELAARLAPFGPVWLADPWPSADAHGLAQLRQSTGAGSVGSPVLIAAGGDAANRLEVKQLLQARSVDLLRVDPVALGGLSEALAVLLLAARFRIPVCPIGRGPGGALAASRVGLIDFVAVGANLDDRAAELDPAGAGWATAALTVQNGACLLTASAAPLSNRRGGAPSATPLAWPPVVAPRG